MNLDFTKGKGLFILNGRKRFKVGPGGVNRNRNRKGREMLRHSDVTHLNFCDAIVYMRRREIAIAIRAERGAGEKYYMGTKCAT